MPNSFFQFKQFTIHHDRCAMKVTTDACLFGAWCAQELQKEPVGGNLLDVGTGTGLLSLMIAQKSIRLIDALEIDDDAAKQAEENIKASPWKDNITIHHSDALNFCYAKKYDVVISNPPFYENELESRNAAKNKAHHGHALRLQEMLALIKKLLKPDGKFLLLLPYKRISEIKKTFEMNQVFIQKELIVSPSATHAPFRLFVHGSLQPALKETASLAIKNEQNLYTSDFVSLLKDYYLYL